MTLEIRTKDGRWVANVYNITRVDDGMDGRCFHVYGQNYPGTEVAMNVAGFYGDYVHNFPKTPTRGPEEQDMKTTEHGPDGDWR